MTRRSGKTYKEVAHMLKYQNRFWPMPSAKAQSANCGAAATACRAARASKRAEQVNPQTSNRAARSASSIAGKAKYRNDEVSERDSGTPRWRTDTVARYRLPQQTLQKLGKDEDIANFVATFERIATQQNSPEAAWRG